MAEAYTRLKSELVPGKASVAFSKCRLKSFSIGNLVVGWETRRSLGDSSGGKKALFMRPALDQQEGGSSDG